MIIGKPNLSLICGVFDRERSSEVSVSATYEFYGMQFGPKCEYDVADAGRTRTRVSSPGLQQLSENNVEVFAELKRIGHE